MKITKRKRQLVLVSCLFGSLFASLTIFSYKKPITNTNNNTTIELDLQKSRQFSYIKPVHKNEIKEPTSLQQLRQMSIEDITSLSRYDGRKVGLTTPVKNQAGSNLCWAYSFAAASEASILKEGFLGDKYNNSTFNLNPDSIDWVANVRQARADKLGLTPEDTFSRPLGHGFSVRKASLALLQWGAPNLMNHEYKSYNNQVAKLENVTHAVVSNGTIPNTSEVKELIAKYGAVAFGYVYARGTHGTYLSTKPVESAPRGFSSHAATIVGWDDTIPKDKFVPKSSRNGGWIVKNSWGSHKYDGGYFYLSYDSRMVTMIAVDYAPNEEYQHNYYYDGINSNIDSPFPIDQASHEELAAVFPALKGTATEKEHLKGVNVSIKGRDVTVEVKVYKDTSPENGSLNNVKPEQGEQVWSKVASFKHAGSYTLKVEDEIELERGSHFSIVVKAKNGTNDGGILVSSENTYTNDLTYYRDENGGWQNCWNVNKGVARIRAFTTTKSTISSESTNDLKYSDVTLTDYVYRHGDPITNINPIVKINGKSLKEEEDYEVSYTSYRTSSTQLYFDDDDDVSVGQVKVTITGKGEYTGTTIKYVDMKAGLKPNLESIGWYSEDDKIVLDIDNKKGNKYSDIKLPAGWEFANPNSYVGLHSTNHLEYNGSDKNLYKQTSFSTALSTSINFKKDISQATIDTTGLYILGRVSKPRIIVTIPGLHSPLQENIDYALVYSDSDYYNGEKVSITITGIGRYFGQKRVIFLTSSLGVEVIDSQPKVEIVEVVDNSSNTNIANTPKRETVQAITPKPTPVPAMVPSIKQQPKPQPTNPVKPTEEIDQQPTKEQPKVENKESNNRQKRDVEPISTKDISDAIVSVETTTDLVYDGKEKQPEVRVQLHSTTLTKDVDYKVNYKDNINAGLASIEIVGINGYSGTSFASFNIKKATPKVSALGVDSNGQVVAKTNTGDGNIVYKYYTDASCTVEVTNPTKSGWYYVKTYVPETRNYSSYESTPSRVQLDSEKMMFNLQELSTNAAKSNKLVITLSSVCAALVIAILVAIPLVVKKFKSRKG